MKNACIFYYNLNPDNIHQKDGVYYFKINNSRYYLYPYYRDIKEVNSLYKINIELKRKNIYVHEIILNKDNNIITIIDNIMYILLKVYIKENEFIDISSISYLTNNTLIKKQEDILIQKDWATLWEIKNDYLEYQISQFGIKYKDIANSFSYYIGLAENAISYARNTLLENKDKINLSLCHRRLNINNTLLDLFNPLEFIIDYRVRDIAEYIKSCFFNNKNNLIDKIDNFFNIIRPNNFEVRMFYARLLYPTYYFDIFEDIIDEKSNENELNKIIVRNKEYEIFLKDVYIYLSKNYYIPEISWILNKKNWFYSIFLFNNSSW